MRVSRPEVFLENDQTARRSGANLCTNSARGCTIRDRASQPARGGEPGTRLARSRFEARRRSEQGNDVRRDAPATDPQERDGDGQAEAAGAGAARVEGQDTPPPL